MGDYFRVGSDNLTFWFQREILLKLEISNSTGQGKVPYYQILNLIFTLVSGNALTIDSAKLDKTSCGSDTRSLLYNPASVNERDVLGLIFQLTLIGWLVVIGQSF